MGFSINLNFVVLSTTDIYFLLIRRWYQTLISLFWLLFGVGDPGSAYIVGAYSYFILVVIDLSLYLRRIFITINIHLWRSNLTDLFLNSSHFLNANLSINNLFSLTTVNNLCENGTRCYEENHHQLTESTGFLLYVLYQLIGSIILMRMLIALMSAALSRIQVHVFTVVTSYTNVNSNI